MANFSLIIALLTLPFLCHGQKKGLYVNKQNKSVLEILDSNKIAIYDSGLSKKNAIILNYNVEGNKLKLSYDCYRYNFKVNFVDNHRSEIILISNEASLSNPIYINGVKFTGNDEIIRVNKSDSAFKIRIELPYCVFDESFSVVIGVNYILDIDFTYQNYDESKFSIIRFKKNKLIVKNIKYKISN